MHKNPAYPVHPCKFLIFPDAQIENICVIMHFFSVKKYSLIALDQDFLKL